MTLVLRRDYFIEAVPDAADLEALRVELQRTADIPDPNARDHGRSRCRASADRRRPVVVGGLAVAYWTTGLYLTGDIDVVMPHSAKIETRLAALGVERLRVRAADESLADGLDALSRSAKRLEHDATRLETWGRSRTWQSRSALRRRAVIDDGYDFRVSTPVRTYAQWRADRDANAAWMKLVDRALPAYERRRPRDAKEAELLRQRGTPEWLIGPSRPD